MKTVKVSLDSYTKIQEFTQIVNQFPNDFDLVQGHYVINAKSIIGVLSLDTSKPISLNIRDAGSQITQILDALKSHIISDESSSNEVK